MHKPWSHWDTHNHSSLSSQSSISSEHEIISHLQDIGKKYSTHDFNDLNEPICIGELPAAFLGGLHLPSKNIQIMVKPTQDLINESIIENIRVAWSLDLLDISFLADKKQISTKQVYPLLQAHPLIAQALIDTYCTVLSSVVKRTRGQKKMLQLRRKISTDIYIAIEKEYPAPKNMFTPELYPLVNEWTLSLHGNKQAHLQLLKDLKPVANAMWWLTGAKRVNLFLDHIEQEEKELEQNIVVPLQQKKNPIQIDTKFLYLDNGHDLYDQILHDSTYRNYYEKDISLIQATASMLQRNIRSRYISLWVGNGAKDFALLKGNKNETHATTLLIDGSIRSLQEAEERFTGTDSGLRDNWYTTIPYKHLLFSQDWIDPLMKKRGNMAVFPSAFNARNSMERSKVDASLLSNTFAILGSTFGNFSHAYKREFLRNMAKIMNRGDNIFLSVFNKPSSEAEIQDIIRHYDTPHTHQFIKNFFIKLWIPAENITVRVTYVQDSIHIDALVEQKNDTPVKVRLTGNTITVPDKTLFKCFQSQRISHEKMQEIITESNSRLQIKEVLSLPWNPFTIYIIEK